MSIRRTRVPAGPAGPTGAVGATGAMVQLYDNVASGAIASWDVSSISASYNHLRLLFSGRGDGTALVTTAKVVFNNDTAANYDSQYVAGQKTTVFAAESIGAAAAMAGFYVDSSATANLASSFDMTIVDYKSTTFYKTFVLKSHAAWGTVTNTVAESVFGGTWRSTSAINRITLSPASGNWIAGSRLTIYGIL